MVMINESQIKSAVRQVTDKAKAMVELRDDGARRAGRLVFRVRGVGERVIPEFYAVYYREGRRSLVKLGAYPTMSLAGARKRFREEFQPAISSGAEPDCVVARRRAKNKAGTVRELFEAYIASLRADAKRSAYLAEIILIGAPTVRGDSIAGAAKALGADRGASSIKPADISDYLARIYERGRRVLAAQTRKYLSAAFSFGMAAEHDYRRKHAGASWGIETNPVDAIPADTSASQPRNRFLTPAELRAFWLWLVEYEAQSRMAPALRLMAATGQRLEEILRVSDSVYEQPRAMFAWPKTKNGLPHAIPLPHQAVAIIDGIKTNPHGLYFPNQRRPNRPSAGRVLPDIVAIFLAAHPEIPHFVPKDLRRTWKTLAGDAGVSKEMRDMLQNHRKSDVSSRHYDRYDGLAEKRAAIAKWAAYLDLVLDGTIKEIGQRDSNVVPIGKGEAA
jgi:integrase